jgi:hypothetical protein
MKLRNALASAAILAIGLFAFAPAADAADTTATFTITGGSLAISVPASTVALNTVSTGASSASGQLGPVTVTDTRGALLATWTTTFSSTIFSTGASASETVALANITYASGLATATTGVGAFVPIVATAMTAAPAGRTVSWAAGIGNTSATWNPTLAFSLLSSQVAGVYTGTVTHSVV